MSHSYKAPRVNHTAVDFTITTMSGVPSERLHAIAGLSLIIPNDAKTGFVSLYPDSVEVRFEEYLFEQVRDFLSGIFSARGVVDPNTNQVHKVSRKDVAGYIEDYLAGLNLEFSIEKTHLISSVDELSDYLAKHQPSPECISRVANVILESTNSLSAFLLKQLPLTESSKNPLIGNNTPGGKDIEILSMSVHVPLLNKRFSLDMALGGYGRFCKNQITCTEAANGLFVDFAHSRVSTWLKNATDPCQQASTKLECLRNIKLMENLVEFFQNGGATVTEINCVNLPRLPREVSGEDHRKFFNILDRVTLRKNTRVFEDLLTDWLDYSSGR